MAQITVSGFELNYRPNTGDEDVLREVIEGDNYSIKELYLPNKPKIIDVGAHIGGFSRLVLYRWPKARVWAIEANRRNWELLEQNLANYPNATICKGAAVGSEPVNKRLIMSKEHQNVTGGWGIQWNGEHPLEPWNVAEPLDKFFYLHDIINEAGQIDLLKIDCEGSEWNIFYHMSTDDLSKISYIVGEFHPGAFLHCDLPYNVIREKILDLFDCPALEKRSTVNYSELYNVFARKHFKHI